MTVPQPFRGNTFSIYTYSRLCLSSKSFNTSGQEIPTVWKKYIRYQISLEEYYVLRLTIRT